MHIKEGQNREELMMLSLLVYSYFMNATSKDCHFRTKPSVYRFVLGIFFPET